MFLGSSTSFNFRSAQHMRGSQILVSGLLIAGSLAAQEPRRLAQPDSIPFALAAALASGGGFGTEPQILVGSMPEWASRAVFVPANGRVLGSAFIGNTLLAIVAVPTTIDSLVADAANHLRAQGWKNPPPTPNFGGGFRPAPSAGASAGNLARATLCKDQQMVLISSSSSRGASTLSFRVINASGYSACRPPELQVMVQRTIIPTLYNPSTAADARMTGDCSTTLGGSSGTNTTLRTAIAPEALLEHYGRQLVDSGWTAVSAQPTTVGRVWTRTDSAGGQLEASLTVTTPPRDGGCRDVTLSIRTQKKP
jgi:hypothetical protein